MFIIFVVILAMGYRYLSEGMHRRDNEALAHISKYLMNHSRFLAPDYMGGVNMHREPTRWQGGSLFTPGTLIIYGVTDTAEQENIIRLAEDFRDEQSFRPFIIEFYESEIPKDPKQLFSAMETTQQKGYNLMLRVTIQ